LAKKHGLSRQSIYAIAAIGEQVLEAGLQPLPHGPQAAEKEVWVDRNRLVRSVVALTEVGVSQRDIAFCLGEMLDTAVSPSWVNGELAQLEQRAQQVNAQWQPQPEETVSGDELYSNGGPNLLVVGNETLYIYALSRQPQCDGETWGCVLLDLGEREQFASDAGKGLAAGAKQAGLAVHQLDWDHLLRPLWGQAARLEKQAYAALEAVAERVRKFDQATTRGRLAQHLAAWERLSADAVAKVSRYDEFQQLARQVDAQFGLIDLISGQVRDPQAGAARLRELGQQLRGWHGHGYAKLSRHLSHWATGLFRYHRGLQNALAPLCARWGDTAIQALSRLWQIEADERRHPWPEPERQARQLLGEQRLDTAVEALGLPQLWLAWEAVCDVLNRSWRGSMLAECVNSLLRPFLRGRKHTDQGCLDLFRFLHNVRPFRRGKRAGHSPAQLAGLDVPDDPFLLLGLLPNVSI
jgi:hypothetical protein